MKGDHVTSESQAKLPYEPPKLIVHGDVRSITGQVSISLESGGVSIWKPPGPPIKS